MAQVSEVARIETALKNKGVKELQWSLWYCRMRQGVASARPADVRYWRTVEEQVQAILEPSVEATVYPAQKKKANRGLGSGIKPGLAAGEGQREMPGAGQPKLQGEKSEE